ncbi:hypothetical protein D3C73_507480 [compost metagenome]
MKLGLPFVCVLLLAILGGIFMSIWEVNPILVVIILFIISFVGLALPTLYTLLWDTNVERMERFLIRNKKKPTYGLIYASANELDEDVRHCIHSLLHKHPQPHKQALYKTIYALYKKDILTAKKDVEFIKPLVYQQYYTAAVWIEEGRLEETRQLIETISTPWMKSAILSEIEIKSDHPDQARQWAKQAFEQAKGLQRYTLYKSYQRKFTSL